MIDVLSDIWTKSVVETETEVLGINIRVTTDIVVDVLSDALAGILTVGITNVLPSIGVGKLPDIDLWSVFGAAITASEFTLTVSPEE